MQRDNVIAIDFDGTIYEKKEKKEVQGASDAIKKLKQSGYILVLWTCRTGKSLSNAKNILKRLGIYDCFDTFNETPQHIRYKTSCKVCASVYIDDRNVGGFIGWDKVLAILTGGNRG